jgi:hypothetical protein
LYISRHPLPLLMNVPFANRFRFEHAWKKALPREYAP